MKVIVDGVFFAWYQTGIAKVWANVLKVWSEKEYSKDILVIDRGNTPFYPSLERQYIDPLRWENWAQDRQVLDLIAEDFGADIFISSYYTATSKTRNCGVIYDMIPERHGDRAPMWLAKSEYIRSCQAFVSISKSTSIDAQKFYGIPEQAIRISYPGVDPDIYYRPNSEEIEGFKKHFAIDRPYYLLIGANWDGYKNAKAFFEAYAKLPIKYAAVAYTGPPLPELAREMLDGNPLIHLGHMPEHCLRSAYAGAIALVYPSEIEGFGLPIIEAQACGCPVIALNNSSIPEALGDVGFMGTGADELAEYMISVQRPATAEYLSRVGIQRSKLFKWGDFADSLWDVMNQIHQHC